MATISLRDHIRWGHDPPSEPTSTVVLTSPARHFVDIRVLRSALSLSQETALTSSPSPALAPENLDWAIGGSSSSEDRSRPDGTHFSHSVFTHWVDSRAIHPETATDESDIFPQPDGTNLETGRMVNPATGLESDYEELWRDGQPDYLPQLPRCTVFQLHDDAQDTRGLFVQLGPHAQGVLRVGDCFTAERWEWSTAACRWERAFAVGDKKARSLDDIIPAIQDGTQKGDKLHARTGSWVVLEVSAQQMAFRGSLSRTHHLRSCTPKRSHGMSFPQMRNPILGEFFLPRADA